MYYSFYASILPDPFAVSDNTYADVKSVVSGTTFTADVLKGAAFPADVKLDTVKLFDAPVGTP